MTPNPWFLDDVGNRCQVWCYKDNLDDLYAVVTDLNGNQAVVGQPYYVGIYGFSPDQPGAEESCIEGLAFDWTFITFQIQTLLSELRRLSA